MQRYVLIQGALYGGHEIRPNNLCSNLPSSRSNSLQTAFEVEAPLTKKWAFEVEVFTLSSNDCCQWANVLDKTASVYGQEELGLIASHAIIIFYSHNYALKVLTGKVVNIAWDLRNI